MALPVPSCPVTIPSMTKILGNTFIDPVTKSQKDIPVIDDIDNQCDVLSWKEFRMSLNINELTTNCENVQAATVTLKGRIPACATQTDYDNIIAILVNDVKTGLNLPA